MKVKTKSGFEFTCDEKIIDDWELYEDFASGNRYGEVRAAQRILGDKDYARLKDHCRYENGRVSYEKMDAEIGEIITAVVSKNS